jgi:hypothetical protein
MTAPEQPRMITHTQEPVRHPWPEDIFIQGGARGVVFKRDGGGAYRTAFVEVMPQQPATFLRGEGPTIAEAETAAWEKYQRILACPAHPDHGPFEARDYTNGAGFCTRCGSWFSRVLPEQPTEPDPDREPHMLEKLLDGDDETLEKVFTTMADRDSLPEKPKEDPA